MPGAQLLSLWFDLDFSHSHSLATSGLLPPDAGDHVLDIGTGTGLLAMMAARIVAPRTAATPSASAAAVETEEEHDGHVTACEVETSAPSRAAAVITG